MFKTFDFKLFKTDIKIHWSLFLVLALYTVPHLLDGKYTEALFGAKMFLTIFSIVVVHEFGHIFTLRKFGYVADKIYLHFFGGLAESSTVWKTPKHLFLIAIAGPATNLIMLIIGLFFLDFNAIDFKNMNSDYALFFCVINLSLFVFNMLPIAPMDGGHVLTSACWSLTKSRDMAAFYAGFISLFIAAFVIAFFIYIGAYSGAIILSLMAISNIIEIKNGFKLKKLMKSISDRIHGTNEVCDVKVKHVNIGDDNFIEAKFTNTRLNCPVTINFVKESL